VDSDASAGGSLTPPRLIIGLGNPGDTYRDTRHNVGFMVLDELARRMNLTFQMEKRWDTLLARHGNTWLIKPQTFMNASGEAASAVARFHKLAPQTALAIVDDVDLPLGSLRLRPAGSAGGHNGLRSLIAHFSTDAFPRLKLGIAAQAGRPAGEKLSNHVLGKFREDERPALSDMIQRAADAVMHALHSGLDAAMNTFNRKQTTKPTPTEPNTSAPKP
jgi:PTH1 family peptidyl-tRNA hydrolase